MPAGTTRSKADRGCFCCRRSQGPGEPGGNCLTCGYSNSVAIRRATPLRAAEIGAERGERAPANSANPQPRRRIADCNYEVDPNRSKQPRKRGRLGMKVKEIMTEKVTFCRPDDNLAAVVSIMWNARLGALPVVNTVGAVMGIITDRD